MANGPLGRDRVLLRVQRETESRRRSTGLILLFLAAGCLVVPVLHAPRRDFGLVGLLAESWTYSTGDPRETLGPVGTAWLWAFRLLTLMLLVAVAACFYLVSEVVSSHPLAQLRQLTLVTMVAIWAGALLLGPPVLFLGGHTDVARGWWLLPALGAWLWHVRTDMDPDLDEETGDR